MTFEPKEIWYKYHATGGYSASFTRNLKHFNGQPGYKGVFDIPSNMKKF
jgi:hypothetical protein